MFSRRHPDDLTPLLDLGRQLRESQEDLAGEALRELSAQAGEVVGAVVDRVRAGAARSGTEPSDAAAREVERTLRAAMADEGATRAVGAGVLVARFAGLDLSDAVAVPVGEASGASPGRTAGRRSARKGRSGAHLERLRQAAQTALEELEQAEDGVARQEARVHDATGLQERAHQRVQELREELDTAERDQARAAARKREVRDEREAALKRARSAHRKAEAAQRRLDAAV